MRIALVVTGGVDRSGRERVIPALLSLIERLARRHEVVVYALRYLDRPTTYELLSATVHDLGSPKGLLRQYTALARALRRDGPFDVIHAYWALPAGLTAAAAGRRQGVPVLVTLDSGELVAIPEIGYGLQRLARHRWAIAATLRLATRLTVCTQFMRRLAQGFGEDPDVVPIGVDAGRFTPGARPAAPPWRLFHAASLNPVKDQANLLNALRQVIERVPDVHLDIAGEDTVGGRIQDLARRIGVDTHVTFHGLLPTDALIELYRQAHLFVLSSKHEAGGVVVLEAAACGLPTAGTAVGYVADWTPDRALAVPPGNAVALAGAVVSALTEPARLAATARAAREWTLAHDADWTADQFDRLYREMTRRATTRPTLHG